ncbi:MAG: hypothetical protein ACMXYA_01640 [Candidatus Woesearchaeota archaeon]
MKAQTSAELILIISVVMIVLGIAISIFLDIPGSDDFTNKVISTEKLRLLPVGIQDFTVSTNCTFMRLQNNNQFTIEIWEIQLDNKPFSLLHFPLELLPAESRSVFDCGYNYTLSQTLKHELYVFYDNPLTLEEFDQNIIIET